MLHVVLYPNLTDQIWGLRRPSLAQCLYGADTLCWNLTVNDRWSAPSLVWPLAVLLLHSHSVRYSISKTISTNNSLTVKKNLQRSFFFGKASFS